MSSAEPGAPLRLAPAEAQDLAEITALFNHEIRTSLALWNTAERTEEEMRAWWEERVAGGYPVIVARLEGRFAGYGTFGPFRSHDGYRATVEHSLYTAPELRGRGIGKSLLAALELEARRQGRHVMVGGIEAGNGASIALHANYGFVETARMPEVGRKFDRWLTLVLMQKRLE